MSVEPTPSPVSRRTVLGAAVWAAPVVALAASAPAAAASGEATFALIFDPNPLVIAPGAPVAIATLSVQNTGATAASGPVSAVVSGMAPDGFTLGAVPNNGWSTTGGSSDDELFFTWNGSLEPDQSSALILVVQYAGTNPRPITGLLLATPADPGMDAVTLQIQMPADEG